MCKVPIRKQQTKQLGHASSYPGTSNMNPCWAAPGLLVHCSSKGLARLLHGLLAQHLAGLKLCQKCSARFAQALCDSPMASNCFWRSKYSRLSIPINRRRHMISRGAPAEQRYRLSLLQWLWLWRSPDRAFHPWEMGCLLFRVIHRGLTSVRWNKLNAFEHGKMCDFFWRSQEKLEKAPSYTFIKSILVLSWFSSVEVDGSHSPLQLDLEHLCETSPSLLCHCSIPQWQFSTNPPKRRKVIQQKLSFRTHDSFSWSVAYLSLNGAWWCHETSQNMHEKSWTHSVHLKHKHSPGCNLQ